MHGLISEVLSTLQSDLGQGHALLAFSLVMVRIITIVSLVPFLGSKNAPGPVKIGISIMISALVWPLAIANLSGPIPVGGIHFMFMLLKEAFVGFAIGFVTAQIFYAVEIAGQIIDIVRFTNQIQLMVPETGERSSPYGDLYYQIALILFLSLGLHELFFEAIIQSFISVPINQLPVFTAGSAPFYEEFMFLFAEIFKIGVTLALPIAAVCLIINITFGLINRVAPQINAYFLSMPSIAVGGMMISFAALSMTFSQFEHFSEQLISHLIKIVYLLG